MRTTASPTDPPSPRSSNNPLGPSQDDVSQDNSQNAQPQNINSGATPVVSVSAATEMSRSEQTENTLQHWETPHLSPQPDEVLPSRDTEAFNNASSSCMMSTITQVLQRAALFPVNSLQREAAIFIADLLRTAEGYGTLRQRLNVLSPTERAGIAARLREFQRLISMRDDATFLTHTSHESSSSSHQNIGSFFLPRDLLISQAFTGEVSDGVLEPVVTQQNGLTRTETPSQVSSNSANHELSSSIAASVLYNAEFFGQSLHDAIVNSLVSATGRSSSSTAAESCSNFFSNRCFREEQRSSAAVTSRNPEYFAPLLNQRCAPPQRACPSSVSSSVYFDSTPQCTSENLLIPSNNSTVPISRQHIPESSCASLSTTGPVPNQSDESMTSCPERLHERFERNTSGATHSDVANTASATDVAMAEPHRSVDCSGSTRRLDIEALESATERRERLIRNYPSCVETLIRQTRAVDPQFFSLSEPSWNGSQFVQPASQNAGMSSDETHPVDAVCWWRKIARSHTTDENVSATSDDTIWGEVTRSSHSNEWSMCRELDSDQRLLQELLRGKWHLSSDLMHPVPESIFSSSTTSASSQSREGNGAAVGTRTAPSLTSSAPGDGACDQNQSGTPYGFRSRRGGHPEIRVIAPTKRTETAAEHNNCRQDSHRRTRGGVRVTRGVAPQSSNTSAFSLGCSSSTTLDDSLPLLNAPQCTSVSQEPASSSSWAHEHSVGHPEGETQNTAVAGVSASTSSNTYTLPPTPRRAINNSGTVISSNPDSPENRHIKQRILGNAEGNPRRKRRSNGSGRAISKEAATPPGGPPPGCEAGYELVKRKTGWHPYVWYLMCRRPELYTTGIRARMVARVAGWEWEDIQKSPSVLKHFLHSILKFLEHHPVPRCMDKREAKQYKNFAANSVRTPWCLVETKAVQRALRQMEIAAASAPATGTATSAMDESDHLSHDSEACLSLVGCSEAEVRDASSTPTGRELFTDEFRGQTPTSPDSQDDNGLDADADDRLL